MMVSQPRASQPLAYFQYFCPCPAVKGPNESVVYPPLNRKATTASDLLVMFGPRMHDTDTF